MEYLLGSDAGPPIRDVLRGDDVDLHVPALCDVEVVAGLRRALLRRAISNERAAEAIQDYLDLPIVRHGHRRVLGRILELRSNVSAYDAAYVALAEDMGAALLTADERLARAVRTHTRIRLLL